MTISPLIAHKVEWSALPVALRPVDTVARRVARVAWNILSILIFPIGLIRLAGHCLAARVRREILQGNSRGAEDFELSKQRIEGVAEWGKRVFESIPTTITAPDGTKLAAHLFRHKQATKETPTTILFGGNCNVMGLPNIHHELLYESIHRDQPMNVLIFDYRSVNQSTGLFQLANDFIIDGLSLVDYVRKRLGTPDDQIHFHGFSLGGAIALKTKAADPKLTGKLVNASSFSTMGNVLQGHAARESCLYKVGAVFVKWFLRVQGLELDAAADLPKVRGPKMIIHHPGDRVIPYTSSLAAQTQEDVVAYEGPPDHNIPSDPRVNDFLFA